MAMIRGVAGAAIPLLVVLATMALQAQAQSTCPGTASMLACQPAVTTYNTRPTQTCCNRVQTVLNQFGPKCLCETLTSDLAKSFKVILSEGVKLPQRCQQLMGLKYVKNYPCGGLTVP